MSKAVRKDGQRRLLAARTRVGESLFLRDVRNHRCDEGNWNPGAKVLNDTLAWAFEVEKNQVAEGLYHLAKQYGACPGCMLSWLFREDNDGPPLWFGAVVRDAYEWNDPEVPKNALLIGEQLTWAAMLALDVRTEPEVRKVLARVACPLVEA